MQRRELLKSLAAVPLAAISLKTGQKVEVAEMKSGRYILFYDVQAHDIEAMFAEPWPEEWKNVDLIAYPVRCYSGRSVADTLAIYKLEEGDAVPETKN